LVYIIESIYSALSLLSSCVCMLLVIVWVIPSLWSSHSSKYVSVLDRTVTLLRVSFCWIIKHHTYTITLIYGLCFSTSLKNLLETVLAVGNYLNGSTEMGQADGYGLDVLNKMKELQDRVSVHNNHANNISR